MVVTGVVLVVVSSSGCGTSQEQFATDGIVHGLTRPVEIGLAWTSLAWRRISRLPSQGIIT
jgi:hypothetical protein